MPYRLYYAVGPRAGPPTVCSECLALVPQTDQTGHDRWHDQLDRKLADLLTKLDPHERPPA